MSFFASSRAWALLLLALILSIIHQLRQPCGSFRQRLRSSPDQSGGSMGKSQTSWPSHTATRYGFEAKKGAREELRWLVPSGSTLPSDLWSYLDITQGGCSVKRCLVLTLVTPRLFFFQTAVVWQVPCAGPHYLSKGIRQPKRHKNY